MPVLFCNIGWMDRYDGIEGDSIQRGGAYNKDAIGHEVCNFSEVERRVYGYVQPTGQIKIEKLGAGKADDSVNGVTVVWTAGPDSGGTAVVGWYKNATVFRDFQKFSRRTKLQESNGIHSYRVTALATDATLLPIARRSFMIPRGVKGGIGQSNVWYADSPESKAIVDGVVRLIESGSDIELPDVDEDAYGLEGNPRLRAHIRRERSSSVVKKKWEQVLKLRGALECEVCGFNFDMIYGELFCEVHHLVPLGKSDGVVKTELSDLAIVCSNCHRVIHRKNPMPTIDDMRSIIRGRDTK